ncbi:CD320 antigen [Sciurus carolinensis]|uniref:CD320 antigen n=1 Tax=Sciurus carolinensis TaxID=30640 RepID=A0AA41N0R3_SCICA|nr:CD320 antigen [Sciurus carolinensis]MBZ3881531.1 CD320 antigen [Sciurus carolinensis]
MTRGGARRTAALGLALRLLLGLGLGLEAASTPASTRTSAQALGPSAGSCQPTSFQCRSSGYCVPLTWRCDGDPDCADGSDEEECRIEPCAQNGQCPPPPGSRCSCDSISGCSGSTDTHLRNCSRQPCPTGELHCALGNTCIPHTWRCDGHPDCLDSSDELGCETNETFQGGNATTMVTPVTLESVTSLRNATDSSAEPQYRNPSVSGVVAIAGVLSASLAAAILLVVVWLRAQGYRPALGLLVAVKESLLLSEGKTSQV